MAFPTAALAIAGPALLSGIGAAESAKAQREAIKAQAEAQIKMLEAESKASLESLQADSEAQQQVIASDSTARIKSLAYQMQTERENIGLIRVQAEDALKRGALDEWSFRREASQAQGAQRAGFASSGVDVNSGSAAYLQEELIVATDLESLAIRQNSQREKYGFDVEEYNTGRRMELAGIEAQSTADVANANIQGVAKTSRIKAKGIRQTTKANKEAIQEAADKQAGGISPLRSGLIAGLGTATNFASSYFLR